MFLQVRRLRQSRVDPPGQRPERIASGRSVVDRAETAEGRFPIPRSNASEVGPRGLPPQTRRSVVRRAFRCVVGRPGDETASSERLRGYDAVRPTLSPCCPHAASSTCAASSRPRRRIRIAFLGERTGNRSCRCSNRTDSIMLIARLLKAMRHVLTKSFLFAAVSPVPVSPVPVSPVPVSPVRNRRFSIAGSGSPFPHSRSRRFLLVVSSPWSAAEPLLF